EPKETRRGHDRFSTIRPARQSPHSRAVLNSLMAKMTDSGKAANSKAALDLLTFYMEAGVDALVGEEPVDRFAPEPAAPAPEARPPAAADRPPSTIRTSLPPKGIP